MRLNPDKFACWFRALNNHDPFPWQERLFRERLCADGAESSRWPENISLPTASGKTSLIELSVFALAAGAECARRRTVFVVDRRVVVDEARERALRLEKLLAEALNEGSHPLKEVADSLMSLGGSKPLLTATLRGGIAIDEEWAHSPLQPLVILSTVDQVGSSLLFRSYAKNNPKAWPIYAGLLGRDSLFIVDEAHCSEPFCETLRAIEKLQGFSEFEVGKPITVINMSATLPGRSGAAFKLDERDLEDEEMARRLNASKKAELVLITSDGDDYRKKIVQEVVERAEWLASELEEGIVGVVLNRVADARSAFERLSLSHERKILLTGRARSWERDRLLESWMPLIRAGSREKPSPPRVVVSTQCIEVGANIDFDALVTEIAPLDSLQQRFGRLNRLGIMKNSSAYIIASEDQVKEKKMRRQTNEEKTQSKELRRNQVGENSGKAAKPDPIYGEAIFRTWSKLKELAKKNGENEYVDFGFSSFEKEIGDTEVSELWKESDHAQPLFPSHLDLLAQTSPPPVRGPNISAFLHGDAAASPDITVVWRYDLKEENKDHWVDIVAVQPPALGEGCQVPIWEFKRWMAGLTSEGHNLDAGDIEGIAPTEDVGMPDRPVLCWRGLKDSTIAKAREVKPGDMVVVPSFYGGCDEFGWNPLSKVPVTDIGDMVAAEYRKPVLRLYAVEELVKEKLKRPEDQHVLEEMLEALKGLRMLAYGEEDAPQLEECLKRIIDVSSSGEDTAFMSWIRKTAGRLLDDKRVRLIADGPVCALVGSRGRGEDSSTTWNEDYADLEVGLEEHSCGVRSIVERFSDGLPADIREAMCLAALYHDIGKADPRFQIKLHRGNEIAAVTSGKLLAKSTTSARDAKADRFAEMRSGYPKGARHEAQSVALLEARKDILKGLQDGDLALHLIASHHGYSRPFLPVFSESEPAVLKFEFNGKVFWGSSDHRLFSLNRGIAERYWKLVRRYGWWGLAYLEAVLRLADHRSSERERTGDEDVV
ncbi:MAG: type I-U CRISPR-associated helicase/endonuclease Cas3 [Actinobacteria bacterium]|nr:type I-U CRISPR-associated helicase/endonuclease Cas3 [Actinomycetota bacterium]